MKLHARAQARLLARQQGQLRLARHTVREAVRKSKLYAKMRRGPAVPERVRTLPLHDSPVHALCWVRLPLQPGRLARSQRS